MRYSIEHRERIYVKGYGYLSFAKNMSHKNSQKLFDSTKKCTTDVIKTVSKRAIQKTAEATGDVTGNIIADIITGISKSPKEMHSKQLYSKADENETEIPKERYISPEKRQKVNDELRLV